ncbi:MAG: SCO family protein [Gammaproteobacteria bacterium]|nr:SCO family protein [Gammaproteobacteria bacterium]
MRIRHFLPRFLAAAVLLAAAGTGAVAYLDRQAQDARLAQTLLSPPKPLSPFELEDSSGGRFGLERLRGRWTLAFFGYTHCPDICPPTAAELGRLLRMTEDNGDGGRLQTLFVSVDPGRDSPQRLANYLTNLHPRLLGLTGDDAQLRRLSGQFGIQGGAAHTSSLFLIDPRARLLAVLPPPHRAEQLRGRLEAIRSYRERRPG